MFIVWQIGERDNPMYGQLINNLQNVAYYGQWICRPVFMDFYMIV